MRYCLTPDGYRFCSCRTCMVRLALSTTIFLEMLFRKIEVAIEGNAVAQYKLHREKWTKEKIVKKVSKHAIFYALSFAIGNTFLAYIIGSDILVEIITSPPSEHIAGLSAMVIFSGIFYEVFCMIPRASIYHYYVHTDAINRC